MSRLEEEIAKFQESIKDKVPKEIKELQLSATQKLVDEGLSANAIKAGDLALEIKLPNAVEKEVSLFNTLEDNDFVVISFYRGGWCPYCNFEMKALGDINDELNELNAKIIAISPETPDQSLTMQEKHDLKFEVLSDANNIVAKQYGLVFSLDERLRPIYESFGIDIPASTGNDSYEIPMPATYVVNKKKEIIFSFIDENYKKRCEPQDILDAIRNYSN